MQLCCKSFGHSVIFSSLREVKPESPWQYCRLSLLNLIFLSKGRPCGSRDMHVIKLQLIVKHSSEERLFSSLHGLLSLNGPPRRNVVSDGKEGSWSRLTHLQMCSWRRLGDAGIAVILGQSVTWKETKDRKGATGRDSMLSAHLMESLCKRGNAPSSTPDHSDHSGICTNFSFFSAGKPLKPWPWLQNSCRMCCRNIISRTWRNWRDGSSPSVGSRSDLQNKNFIVVKLEKEGSPNQEGYLELSYLCMISFLRLLYGRKLSSSSSWDTVIAGSL